MARIIDWPARMKEVADFVGLGQTELDLIQATREVVLERGEELTAAVYDHFLEFPESRRFFADENGHVNDERLTRRKHSLLRWLRGSIDFKIDEDYPIRLLATGIVHSHPPSHRAHLGSIPSRYMIGTISYIQTAISEILHRNIADPGEAALASAAWNKMLMVQLDILLAGYVIDVPNEPLAGPPDSSLDGLEVD
jgi:hemoglobin-like flavoprotein